MNNEDMKISLIAKLDQALSIKEMNKQLKEINKQMNKLDLGLEIDTSNFKNIQKQLKDMQTIIKAQNNDKNTQIRVFDTEEVSKGKKVVFNSIDEAIKKYEKFATVTSKPIFDNQTKQLKSFILELERASGLKQRLEFNPIYIANGNKLDRAFDLGMIKQVNDAAKVRERALNEELKIRQKIAQMETQDQRGFDFSKYSKMSNAIREVTNAEAYKTQSMLEGKKVLEATIFETEKYIKVNQKLREGSQITNISAYINRATGETHKFNESFRDLATRAYDAGSALKTAYEKMLLWSGAGALIYGSTHAFQNLLSVIVQLDTKMTELKKVMDSQTDFKQVLHDTVKVANDYGATLTDSLGSLSEWARAGYNASDSMKLLESSLLGANVMGIDAKQVAENLTAALNTYELSADQATRFIDSLNEVKLSAS